MKPGRRRGLNWGKIGEWPTKAKARGRPACGDFARQKGMGERPNETDTQEKAKKPQKIVSLAFAT